MEFMFKANNMLSYSQTICWNFTEYFPEKEKRKSYLVMRLEINPNIIMLNQNMRKQIFYIELS